VEFNAVLGGFFLEIIDPDVVESWLYKLEQKARDATFLRKNMAGMAIFAGI
jgi:hypothetical protein